MTTRALLQDLAVAGQGRALPPGLYRDPGILALEQERVFARDWVCLGRAADIARPGDYLAHAILDQPVVAVRGEDGVIRTFSNICRHRMMRLVEGQGSCRRLVCPYHAWTYDLTGRVVGAPHMKRTPGFEPGQERLPEIRTEIWEGWIYASLNPAAEPLAPRLEPLLALVERYRMADYLPVVTQDHVWETNWKILAENFMEGYHLPVAHRRTVGAWFPVDDTGFPEQRFDAFTYQTFTKDETATYGRAHASNTRLEGHWRGTSVMPTIFPSHMYVLAPDHLWYLSLQPQGTGQVRLRFGMAVAPEVAASVDMEAHCRDMLAFFDRVNEEDRGVVEAIYRNSAAPLAAPGPLSWLEQELGDFAAYLARRLGAAPSGSRPRRRTRGRGQAGRGAEARA
jgi:phenylpropionate dioxygenase-like ring-hydroxylating dioxygenase large terminal subunit